MGRGRGAGWVSTLMLYWERVKAPLKYTWLCPGSWQLINAFTQGLIESLKITVWNQITRYPVTLNWFDNTAGRFTKHIDQLIESFIIMMVGLYCTCVEGFVTYFMSKLTFDKKKSISVADSDTKQCLWRGFIWCCLFSINLKGYILVADTVKPIWKKKKFTLFVENTNLIFSFKLYMVIWM